MCAQCCTHVEGADKIIALGALFHDPAPKPEHNNYDDDFFDFFPSRDIETLNDNQIRPYSFSGDHILLFGAFTSRTHVLYISYK